MVDELLDLRTCRICGAPVIDNENTGETNGDVCARCTFSGSEYGGADSPPSAPSAEPEFLPVDSSLPAEPLISPDNPPWGPLTGLGTWLFSLAASIAIPLIPLLIVLFSKISKGESPESAQQWVSSASALLILTIATLPAHLVILLFCWAVVTRLGKRPFFQTLGWSWAGRSVLYWLLVSVGVVVAINVVSNLLLRWLPERPSPFDEMLKSSQSVKFATVCLAVISAPLIEEVVYRGVLFSAIRKRVSAAVTVVAVTIIFVGVHVPQYIGAWRTIAGLTLLSLALTVVRARTASVLPCFIIHLLNNALSSVAILLDKG